MHALTGTPLTEIVRVMRARRSIEDCFETEKSLCLLAHYEVPSEAWMRHVTLSMAALVFLNVTATRTDDTASPAPPAPEPDQHGRPHKGHPVAALSI
ncbi:hypothetical protein AAH978_14260 [Streptomyces sp. ZYX-F-203]